MKSTLWQTNNRGNLTSAFAAVIQSNPISIHSVPGMSFSKEILFHKSLEIGG